METRFPIALTKCFYCNADDQILMSMRSTSLPEGKSQVEMAHGKIINMDPCKKCRGLMDQGVILITIDNEKSGKDWHKPPPGDSTGWMPNPYRTGGWFVIKDEALKKIIDGPLADWAIKHRFMFIEHEAAEKLGLFKMAAKEDEKTGAE